MDRDGGDSGGSSDGDSDFGSVGQSFNSPRRIVRKISPTPPPHSPLTPPPPYPRSPSSGDSNPAAPPERRLIGYAPYFYSGGVQGPTHPIYGPAPLIYHGPPSPRANTRVSTAASSPNGSGIVVLQEVDSRSDRMERMQEAARIPLPEDESSGECWHP